MRRRRQRTNGHRRGDAWCDGTVPGPRGDLEADPALGITADPYATQVRHLRPGDRLLLVTDGFLERNATTLDIRATLEATSDRHLREIVRELAFNVLDASGNEL